MKKVLISVIIMIILVFIGFEILTESNSILNSVSFSFKIWENNIFPSLFPFFILSELLVNYGFVEFLSELFKPIMNHFFKINSNAAFVFVMSMISGFPSNAKYTRKLYEQGLLNENEASKVLTFTHFSNPLFILGTVVVFLNNKEAGLLVLIVHYFTNLIIGFIFRNYYQSKKERSKISLKKAILNMHQKRISNNMSFGKIITTAINNSINTLLLILGTVTIFLIITTIIDNSLNILDSLSLKYRGKLKIIDRENGGAGYARNIGLDNASGEFIKFVDADDYLNVNILEKMYSLAKEHGVSLVRGNYQTVVGPFKMEDKCSWSNINGSQIVDIRKNKDYIVTETPGIGNKLISRSLIDNLRFPEKTKWEDLAIVPVIIASSEKIFHLDKPVYNYRINMNTTIKDFINKIPNILDIIKCVNNIEQQMKSRGLSEEYKEQIESIYILHTLFRVENAMLWVNFPRDKKKL